MIMKIPIEDRVRNIEIQLEALLRRSESRSKRLATLERAIEIEEPTGKATETLRERGKDVLSAADPITAAMFKDSATSGPSKPMPPPNRFIKESKSEPEPTGKITQTLNECSGVEIKATGATLEVVQVIASTGAICEVFGHWMPPEYETSLPDSEGMVYRTCRLCKYSEQRKRVERTRWVAALGRSSTSLTIEAPSE